MTARPLRRAAAVLAASAVALTGTLVAAAPASAEPTTPTFTDIATNPFREEINFLAMTGATNGWPNGDGTAQYRPLTNINRDTFAAMMFRLMGIPDSYPAPAKSPFLDVPTTHTFYREIAFLHEIGITEGWAVKGGREFRPSTPVNRDVMAAFLYRILEGDEEYPAPAKSPFRDVPTSHVFYDEIAWMADYGISEGWPAAGGKRDFRPTVPVKRDVFAAFISRIVQGPV